MTAFEWLLPWDFSPTVLLCCVAALTCYARGVRRLRLSGVVTPLYRQVPFYLGVALLYIPLQTGYDYWAQHMFWMHRLQHFMLHDFASFLVALAAPWSTLAAGLPAVWRGRLHAVLATRFVRRMCDGLRQPLVAYFLFVGLIYVWLWPSIHFRAMLSLDEYKCMNWSVALDGLLFWSLILDPRSRSQGAIMHFGPRIPLALLTMIPETLVGAYLSLSQHEIYTVYDICGRLWPISAVTDQQLGGLIIWIPASFMCSAAALIVMRRWVHHDALVNGVKLPVRAVEPVAP